MTNRCAAAPCPIVRSSAANRGARARRDPKARHGPCHSLTHAVEGKTRSRFLTDEQADLAQQQIDAGRQFRSHVDALWEACEQWADGQLADTSASPEEAEKGGSKRDLQSEIAQEIEAVLGSQAVAALDFEAVEMAARRQALRLAARALEQRLNADTSDHAGVELPSLTPGVLRMTGSTAALVSFEESSSLLHELAGVKVSISQVQRAAESLGDDIVADERVCVDRMGEIAPTMYLGMDGTGVPMRPRAEVADRSASSRTALPKPARPRSSRCGLRNRGMRTVSRYVIQDRSLIRPPSKAPPPQTPASNDPTSPNACCEKPRGEGSPRRPDARRWGMVPAGSGTPPRNCFLKPSRFSIGTMPKKLCTEPLNRSLAQPTRKPNHGPLRAVPNWMTESCRPSSYALRPHIGSSNEAAKCATYIIRNRRRMRYPKFHAQGLCTSTGVLEAGCKVAIGTRLKRAGMHWSVSGANAIIALRCAKLSGRFEDFWERRSQHLAATA